MDIHGSVDINGFPRIFSIDFPTICRGLQQTLRSWSYGLDGSIEGLTSHAHRLHITLATGFWPFSRINTPRSLAMPKMQQAVLSQLPKRRKKDERLARLFSRFLKNLKRPPTVKNPANSNPFQISFFFPRFLSTFFFSPTESSRASVPSLG